MKIINLIELVIPDSDCGFCVSVASVAKEFLQPLHGFAYHCNPLLDLTYE